MNIETIRLDPRIARIHYGDYRKRCAEHRAKRREELHLAGDAKQAAHRRPVPVRAAYQSRRRPGPSPVPSGDRARRMPCRPHGRHRFRRVVAHKKAQYVTHPKAHLPADEEKTLCGRWRSGGTETLVGPPRMQLKAFICSRCWKLYTGPIGPNREPGTFQTRSEKP